jgi:hypothetical protein
MSVVTEPIISLRKQLETAPKIYIANFGISNALWPRCLNNSYVETFSHSSALPFIQNGDKDGFIANAMAKEWTARGIRPNKGTASRWYNVSKIFESTSADIWIHRCDDDIWWTISLPDPYSISFHPSHAPEASSGDEVFHTSKPTMAWSRKDLAGRRLSWKGAHPKARHFLATEATLQRLSKDYAPYALAMILGEDLSEWHDLPLWKKVLHDSRKGEVSISSAKQNAAYEMALTAWNTTKNSNGQSVERKVKNKDFGFATVLELEAFVSQLLDMQQGICALSGLPLQYRESCEDPAMLCSLDRIDSGGHYERGNLQVVCRFVNKWKSSTLDDEFRRLLHIIRDPSAYILD